MIRPPAPVRLLLLLFLLTGSRASAASPIAATPLPVTLPPSFALRDFGTDLEPACNPVYQNEYIATGFYIPVGAGVELADDLHTTLGESQAICAFDLGYFNPGPATVDALVTFYANGPADPLRGAVIAGPYLVRGLPPGVNAFHIEVGGGIVQPDVWMGVAFSDPVTGLLSFDPPGLGSSHDLVWITPPGAPGNFGGPPPANLFLGLYSSPSTPARPATWGGLKAHYR